MSRSRRPSAQTISVLLALAKQPTTWRYGYDLCQQLGLKAGSMYPILIRLADRGLLETAWETDPPMGRPPRHLYRLTGLGRALASEWAEQARARVAGPTALRVRWEGTACIGRDGGVRRSCSSPSAPGTYGC